MNTCSLVFASGFVFPPLFGHLKDAETITLMRGLKCQNRYDFKVFWVPAMELRHA